MARANAWCGKCSLLMSRFWLDLGARSTSPSAAYGVGSRSTGQRGWLAASHETHAHCSPVPSGAGSDTSTRSWLQPGASAQPRTNSPHRRKLFRAWMEPSAKEQPQATCGSLGCRAWFNPSASAQPQAKANSWRAQFQHQLEAQRDICIWSLLPE